MDNLVKKNNKTNADITEFYSKRLMLTERANDINNNYSKKNIMGIFFKKYIFDGIQFNINEPYYSKNTFYANLIKRNNQPFGKEYVYYKNDRIFG